MPRYFFDTHDGDHLVIDEEGLELDNLAYVRREALSALSDIARDAVPKGPKHAMFISVRDERRNVIFRATLPLNIVKSPT